MQENSMKKQEVNKYKKQNILKQKEENMKKLDINIFYDEKTIKKYGGTKMFFAPPLYYDKHTS